MLASIIRHSLRKTVPENLQVCVGVWRALTVLLWFRSAAHGTVRRCCARIDTPPPLSKHTHTHIRFSTQDHFVQCTSDAQELKSALAIQNSLFGYVYLLDPKARIRWRAAGNVTETEIETMLSLAKKLSSR